MKINRYVLISLCIFVAIVSYLGFYRNLLMFRGLQYSGNRDEQALAVKTARGDLGDMQEMVGILVQSEEVQRLDPILLGRTFSRIAKQNPEINNLVVFDKTGRPIKAMQGYSKRMIIGDRNGVNIALSGKSILSNKFYGPTMGKWLISYKVPIIDEKGRINGVVSAALGTERLQATLRGIQFEYGAFPILTDATGGIIYYPNRSQDADDAFRKRVFTEFKGADAGSVRLNSPLTGENTVYSFERINAEGWYIVVAQPVRNLLEEIIRQSLMNIAVVIIGCLLLYSLHRYSELKEGRVWSEREAQLEKLQAVGQLAAGIAHEIRNPLTTVKGFLQLMQCSPGKEQNLDYLGIMLEEINSIEQITHEFLSLAKPSVPKITVFNLNDLLRNVEVLLQTHAIMQNVKLNLELDESLPRVAGDDGQIKQVVINLVKNAVEACVQGGVVTLTSGRGDNGVEIGVKDNGQGIAPDILAKLGTPFFTTKEAGSGLGLVVCFRVVHNLGGAIVVTSEPGEGTNFLLQLPLTLQESN